MYIYSSHDALKDAISCILFSKLTTGCYITFGWILYFVSKEKHFYILEI